MKYQFLAILFLLPALAGCVPFPVRWQDTPPLKGQVLDAASSKPIAGAVVTVRSGDSDRSTTAKTDEGGRFDLAPVTHWRVVLAPMDPLQSPPTISISARGYRPYEMTSFDLRNKIVRLEPGS